MFVNIYISSKNYSSIKKFLTFFINKKITRKLKLTVLNYQIPSKMKKFTVLKSPHVNKTAQEQFNYKTYKTQITLHTYQIFLLITLIKFIKIDLFTDINIKVELISNHKVFYNKIINLINSNNYFIDNNNFFFFNNYLKLMDIHGEILLNKIM